MKIAPLLRFPAWLIRPHSPHFDRQKPVSFQSQRPIMVGTVSHLPRLLDPGKIGRRDRPFRIWLKRRVKYPRLVVDVDMVSVTAHKMHGPIGVGAACAERPIRRLLSPLLNGGGQEGGEIRNDRRALGGHLVGLAALAAPQDGVGRPAMFSKLRDQLGLLAASTDDQRVNGSDGGACREISIFDFLALTASACHAGER